MTTLQKRFNRRLVKIKPPTQQTIDRAYKECAGCKTLGFGKCLLMVEESRRKICPCIKCLVKVTCIIPCQQRKDLWNAKSIENYKKIYHKKEKPKHT